MLVSAVLTFWGLWFCGIFVSISGINVQLFQHIECTNYKCEGMTITTTLFSPDLFLLSVETLLVHVLFSQRAALSLHALRNRVIFWESSHPQSNEVIHINFCASSAKVEYFGSMFNLLSTKSEGMGKCHPTSVKSGKKYAFQQLQRCLLHMLCLASQGVTCTFRSFSVMIFILFSHLNLSIQDAQR